MPSMCECGFCTGPCVQWNKDKGEENQVALPLKVRLCDDVLDHTMWAWIVRIFVNGTVYVRAIANINGCLGWYLFRSLMDATRATFALMHISFPVRFEDNVDLLWYFKTASGFHSVRELRLLKADVSILKRHVWEPRVALKLMRCRATALVSSGGPTTRSRSTPSLVSNPFAEASPFSPNSPRPSEASSFLPPPPPPPTSVQASQTLLSTFDPPVEEEDPLISYPPSLKPPHQQPPVERRKGKAPNGKRKRLLAGQRTRDDPRRPASSSYSSLPASPKHTQPPTKIAPYRVDSIGTNSDIANILRSDHMPWSNDTIVELLSNAAHIPLVHVASVECNRYGLIECSFGLPDGTVVNHVWVQLNLMTYHYMAEVKHLMHTKMV